MWKLKLKAAVIIMTTLSLTSIAHAADDPVEILLNQVKLDLDNPDVTAKRIIEKDFKSNDPLMRSRVYAMNDGTRVKLVGRNFNKSADIDRIRITYPQNETVYQNSYAALAKHFGEPSANRRGVIVWRLKNTNPSLTQSRTVKIIAGRNKSEKRTITTDRRGGGKGNNPRLHEHSTGAPPIKTTRAMPPKTPPVQSKESDF